MVRALTVEPGRAGSLRVDELAEPPGHGEVLVDALALGICGTDAEIVAGDYGWSPEGRERLVLGHESLGRVLEAPAGAPVAAGDLVVGIVRRPDPVPCACCAVGEWDMCRNGEYTERGIKSVDGYGAERWRVEPGFAVRIDPDLGLAGVLMEPTSILAKAWDQIERIGGRACHVAERCVVTGAGPIGLLAALLAVQRGLETTVVDIVEEGPKPGLVRDLGATYHAGSVTDLPPADVIVECSGVGQVVLDVMSRNAPGAIVCLTGVSGPGRKLELDAGALNRHLVLQNDVVFGSVNANRRHYELAAEALARADRGWLERLITRRVPLDRFEEALERRDGDVKTVLELGA